MNSARAGGRNQWFREILCVVLKKYDGYGVRPPRHPAPLAQFLLVGNHFPNLVQQQTALPPELLLPVLADCLCHCSLVTFPLGNLLLTLLPAPLKLLCPSLTLDAPLICLLELLVIVTWSPSPAALSIADIMLLLGVGARLCHLLVLQHELACGVKLFWLIPPRRLLRCLIAITVMIIIFSRSLTLFSLPRLNLGVVLFQLGLNNKALLDFCNCRGMLD